MSWKSWRLEFWTLKNFHCWLEWNLCDPPSRHGNWVGLRTYGRNSARDTMPGAFSFQRVIQIVWWRAVQSPWYYKMCMSVSCSRVHDIFVNGQTVFRNHFGALLKPGPSPFGVAIFHASPPPPALSNHCWCECVHCRCGWGGVRHFWRLTLCAISLRIFAVFFQELEIVIGDEHISFTTSKIGSLVDVNQSKWVNKSVLIFHEKTKRWAFSQFQDLQQQIWSNFAKRERTRVRNQHFCAFLLQGSWRAENLLLLGTGSEVFGVLLDRTALQDQANLIFRRARLVLDSHIMSITLFVNTVSSLNKDLSFQEKSGFGRRERHARPKETELEMLRPRFRKRTKLA